MWLLPIQSENIIDGYAYNVNESYKQTRSEPKEDSKIVITSSWSLNYKIKVENVNRGYLYEK